MIGGSWINRHRSPFTGRWTLRAFGGPDHDVVVGIGRGSFHFRSRITAALFRWSYRRATGWTSWDYLDPEVQATSVKLRPSPYLYGNRRRDRLNAWGKRHQGVLRALTVLCQLALIILLVLR